MPKRLRAGAASTTDKSETDGGKKRQRVDWPPSLSGEELIFLNVHRPRNSGTLRKWYAKGCGQTGQGHMCRRAARQRCPSNQAQSSSRWQRSQFSQEYRQVLFGSSSCCSSWYADILPIRSKTTHRCVCICRKLSISVSRKLICIPIAICSQITFIEERGVAGSDPSTLCRTLKPRGTGGAIPLSSTLEAGDPKWDCTRLPALPWVLYCLKRSGTLSFAL